MQWQRPEKPKINKLKKKKKKKLVQWVSSVTGCDRDKLWGFHVIKKPVLFKVSGAPCQHFLNLKSSGRLRSGRNMVLTWRTASAWLLCSDASCTSWSGQIRSPWYHLEKQQRQTWGTGDKSKSLRSLKERKNWKTSQISLCYNPSHCLSDFSPGLCTQT